MTCATFSSLSRLVLPAPVPRSLPDKHSPAMLTLIGNLKLKGTLSSTVALVTVFFLSNTKVTNILREVKPKTNMDPLYFPVGIYQNWSFYL